ncbi:MAG: fucose isomerase [Pyrinomonadaceae bacterium]|nr:fucose isomerase [Phycisphaerales bacterium]
MPAYQLPTLAKLKPAPKRTAILIASGDLRESANAACWAAQQELEQQATAAFESIGWKLSRAALPSPAQGTTAAHGFINSQKVGRDVFAGIHPDAPLVIAEAVWQYSHHVLIGLQRHQGPILILANWSGTWPGLVGALNLRGSLTKAGVEYSLLWAEDFASPDFRASLAEWTIKGRIKHDLSHVQRLDIDAIPGRERTLGTSLAAELAQRPAIMGIFDEGCMGMFNAIIPDHLLHETGVFKERLSQSALYYAMTQVPDEEADAVRAWLDEKGMRFITGPDEATDLTDTQIRTQCKMYIAACRIADDFGCDAIGIQYQQGLKDLSPASDLAEGLLNCSERPPVRRLGGAAEVIREGRPLTHFNEVDECAGLDGIITQRVWTAMGLPPDNTLHDLRWGEAWGKSDEGTQVQSDEGKGSRRVPKSTHGQYVWVFEISGAVPPSHLIGGYAGAVSERQPAMYFRLGGGTIKGISKPGEVVWSRIYVGGKDGGRLHMDIGRCKSISLPQEETQRRWNATTPQWPIMHAVLYGISRDQMMARHQSNHIQVAYAPTAAAADKALAAKAAMAEAMGIRVHLCGDNASGKHLGDMFGKRAR